MAGKGNTTYGVVITEQLIEEVKGFVTDEALVLRSNERVPRLARESRQNLIVLGIQFNVVLIEILKERLGSKNLGNLHQLIGVTVAVEERLFAEDHRCKHSTERPHIERVVILLEVNKKLGALEVSRRNTDVILGTLVVELSQTPINQTKLG